MKNILFICMALVATMDAHAQAVFKIDAELCIPKTKIINLGFGDAHGVYTHVDINVVGDRINGNHKFEIRVGDEIYADLDFSKSLNAKKFALKKPMSTKRITPQIVVTRISGDGNFKSTLSGKLIFYTAQDIGR